MHQLAFLHQKKREDSQEAQPGIEVLRFSKVSNRLRYAKEYETSLGQASTYGNPALNMKTNTEVPVIPG